MAATSSNPTNLFQLPQELLLRVSFHLSTSEFGYFRQTCRHVEAALFDSFSKEFFTKKQFMIEHVSLQALVDIANHPTLSRQLSELIISLHTFENDSGYERPSSKERYRAGHVSRGVLLETGQARDMLVEAFSKLPNLRTVGLRDYNAHGRLRDGQDTAWRSYGWTHGFDHGLNTALAPPILRRSMDLASPESTLPLLIYALGCARAKPENIEVFLRRRLKLTPASFNLLDGFMAPKTVPVLAGLRRLMLTIALDAHNHFGPPRVPHDNESVTNVPLKRLLHHTPALETLRLNFDPEQSFAQPLLEWLGKPVSVSTPAAGSALPPVLLSHLTSLDLGMLNVEARTLHNVTTKFRLVSLSLWKVTLICKDLSELHEEVEGWTRLLNGLSEAHQVSSPLKSVLIGFPSHGRYSDIGVRTVQVYFDLPTGNLGDQKRTSPLDRVTYRASCGTSVGDWFHNLAIHTAFDSDQESSEDGEDDELTEEDESEEEEDVIEHEDI